MNIKTRQIYINLVVLILAICFSVIMGEALLRIFMTEPDENKWVGAEKKFYEYDSVLGWKKIPNLDTTRVTGIRPPVIYKINSKSIRGPEYSFDKAENEYRILILGDSFAEGYMVEFHELFSEVMKKKLNGIRDDKYYETINAGTSGWSTDQELIFFQNEGKKYNPDLTILMFYQNDINYNNQPKDWGMYYKPLFKIEDEEIVLSNVPVPKPDIFIIHDHLEYKQTIFKRLRAWLNLNSYLYKLVKERVKNTYSLRSFVTRNILDENQTGEETFIPIEYRVWEKESNETVRDSWEITEAMILKLREEVESVGSEFLVFYIPFEGSIYQEEWVKLKRVYNLSDENWTPDQAVILLKDICTRHNIDLINPTEVFKDYAREIEKKKKRRLYDFHDHHWNAEGNKLVGEILKEYINLKYLRNME
jgi:hypothetical protein